MTLLIIPPEKQLLDATLILDSYPFNKLQVNVIGDLPGKYECAFQGLGKNYIRRQKSNVEIYWSIWSINRSPSNRSS